MAGRRLAVSMASVVVVLGIAGWQGLEAAGQMGTPVPRAAADKSGPSLGPPTAQELMEIVRDSAVLRQAVQKAAPKMGLDPNKVLATPAGHVPGLQPGELVQAPPSYPLAPLDWDNGVWLTSARPVATATLPLSESTDFAYLIPHGVYWEPHDITKAADAQALAAHLPGFGRTLIHGPIWVYFHPPTDGLYLAAICLPYQPPAGFLSVRPVGGSVKILGTDVAGKKVVAVIGPGTQYAGSLKERAFLVEESNKYVWSFIGVLLKRLSC